MKKLLTISELSKTLNLISSINNKPKNYILRYWEKEFKQIKPRRINNQRYYSIEQVELIKLINFLLKKKNVTISGVKKILDLDVNNLDDGNSHSLKADYIKSNLKKKSKNLVNIIKRLKIHGKKNSFKS